MRNKLLITILLLTAATSTYSAQGKGYREYGEEIYSAPGFNFRVEEVPPGTGTDILQKKHLWRQDKHKSAEQKRESDSIHHS